MQEKVKTLRKLAGVSQRKFAGKYNIPARTIENWEEGKTEPPSYVVGLLKRAVVTDHIIEIMEADKDESMQAKDEYLRALVAAAKVEDTKNELLLQRVSKKKGRM